MHVLAFLQSLKYLYQTLEEIKIKSFITGGGVIHTDSTKYPLIEVAVPPDSVHFTDEVQYVLLGGNDGKSITDFQVVLLKRGEQSMPTTITTVKEEIQCQVERVANKLEETD